ncbi:aminoglycoside 6-adenylyltransferase [Flavobacterium sp. W1B]|uniref:aminoglycoside 6-adenylyltransferase n=1 Tax=Flavobacterium sp. W1B TaxID=3394146 RepID=UPI0039BCD4EF
MVKATVKKLKLLSENSDDIYGTIVLGSITAKDAFPNINVFFITKNPKKYLSENDNWLLEIGTPISKLNMSNAVENVMISRVMLFNCVILDIIPIDYSELKKASLYFNLKKYNLGGIIPKNVNSEINNRLRTFYHYVRNEHAIIYDKGNVTSIVNEISNYFDDQQHNAFLYQVDKEKFYQNYNEFWQSAFKAIGLVVGNELYYGITIYENILKRRLIELIEWYMFSFENTTNLLCKGKGVYEWANENIKSKLRKTFVFDDKKNSFQSIENTILLYMELSHKIIEKYKFHQNEILENKVSNIIIEFRNRI